MKIIKTILRYLMYGIVLFLMSGFMFTLIKNSDKSDNAKKIFDDTRNFAKQPSVQQKEYVPKTKPYKKNQSDCLRMKERAQDYSTQANKFNMDTATSACQMAKNLKEVVGLMEKMEQNTCIEYDKFTFETYKNLLQMSTSKCRK